MAARLLGTISAPIPTVAQFHIIFNGLFLHQPTLEEVIHIEKDILESYSSKKTPVYTIQKQYKHKHLKISGLWENDTSFGIVFKFI